ncbi:MAG: hypothetical protein J5685_00755 [Clostridiales bacterium]|nr:hypothetical protein [Clostridiales bacterium]
MKKILSGLFYRLIKSIEIWGLLILIISASLYTSYSNLTNSDYAFMDEEDHVYMSDGNGGEVLYTSDMLKALRFSEGDVSAFDVYRTGCEPVDARSWPAGNHYEDEMYTLFRTLSRLHLFPVILISIFIPVFYGRLFSDGTVKNLISCGHGKGAIYLSCLFLTAGIDIAMYIIEIVIYSLMCLIGGWAPPVYLPTVIPYVGVNLLVVITISSLSLCILFASRKKTASFVVGFIVFLSFLFSMPTLLTREILMIDDMPDTSSESFKRYYEIIEEEDHNPYVFYTKVNWKTFDGEIYYNDEKLDLSGHYLYPSVKKVLIWVYYLDPNMETVFFDYTGQPYAMARDGFLTIGALAKTFWIISFSACGIIIFKKKEISQ